MVEPGHVEVEAISKLQAASRCNVPSDGQEVHTVRRRDALVDRVSSFE